ncbi:MAG: dihydrofolate reductase [Ruminococcus sp.]|nr:dihydrofolate reductase [Ruminococcus sp.]
MKLIVAVDENWGIGKNGDLLLSIPDDMRYFRETTRRAVLVMGYNTLLSFPNSKPLPNRMNLVLADIEGVKAPGTVVCGSMEQLFGIIKDMNTDDIFVIGGGYTYRQFLPYCDTAYITKMRFCGDADTFIPNLDELSEWSAAEESEVKEYEGVKYSFVTYHNSEPKAVGFSGVNADMPRYFEKKEPLTVGIAETDDKEYRKELKALLHAYFRPLEQGVSADEVAAFLDGGDSSFEDYLRGKRLIAGREDIDALADRYDLADKKAVSVTVDKNNLSVIDELTD